jgi:hypothetical protein
MVSARDGVGNDLTGKGSSLLTVTTESASSTNQMSECDDAAYMPFFFLMNCFTERYIFEIGRFLADKI